ncbi:hypothetical protein MPSI1_003339 [Malassezia psittaci]|uniref:FAD/NAD(P)-binding domain-containing protein n=1 Tax=Malassezia psittaci TaxID=1821823 RepID=A0AAF0JFR6_9BASI|nr:hypothetical protein MPSI1_003339 [Malassezia psittaci]
MFTKEGTKNVIVLGGSYGGMHAAMVLAKKLPASHRVILVEQNSHFNHLYVFPRFTVYPGHEHKAFVPYTSIFSECEPRKKVSSSILDASNLHAQPKQSDLHGAPLGASGVEEAIIEDHQQLLETEAKSTHRENKVVDVEDMLDDKLHLNESDPPSGSASPLHTRANGNSDESKSYHDAEPHLVVCGKVISMTTTHVTVRQHNHHDDSKHKNRLWAIDTVNIPYSHLIYALGSHMPDPLRHDTYSKEKSVSWMRDAHNRIAQSQEIVLVGGGALGVELATDIKTLFPEKDVTLIHSRKQLLPNFDARIHEHASAQLKKLGVNLVLGHRLALAEGCPMGSNVQHFEKQTVKDAAPSTTGKPKPTIIQPVLQDGADEGKMRHRIRTTLGLELECDLLLLCTGQQPNSSIMANFSPQSVSHDTRLVNVMRTLQVMIADDQDGAQQPFEAVPPCKDCDCFVDHKTGGALEHTHLLDNHEVKQPRFYPHIYAIGDVANAFGALNAGYQAWFMGETAAANILRDITRRTDPEDPSTAVPDNEPVPLEEFEPRPDMIKLTIGGGKIVSQGAPERDESLPGKPMRPTISEAEDTEDMYIESVWKNMALADPSDMAK